MKAHRNALAPVGLILTLCAPSFAQTAATPPTVLITNANVFDGKSETLATGMSVLVEGNKIAKIAKSIPAPAGATVIDAAGRTLSPGFIDAHVRITLQFNIATFTSSDESQFALKGTFHDSMPHDNGAPASRHLDGRAPRHLRRELVAGQETTLRRPRSCLPH